MKVKIFDRIDSKSLDRRETQLWLLALTVILVLTGGLALLMYPAVFGDAVVLTSSTLKKAFFGFCGLSGLLVAYLVDRQIVVRNLRRQLAAEQNHNTALRLQASADVLDTLPQYSHFRDRLPMEIRRAAASQRSLSLLIVRIKPAKDLTDTTEISTAYGDAAKSIARRLRREDSIYVLCPSVFGVLLPGANAAAGYRVADRFVEALHDASGASNRFTSEVQIIAYPEHVDSSSGLELSLKKFFAEHDLVPPRDVEDTAPQMELVSS